MAGVKLRGLPFDVTENDILHFFAAYQIKEGSLKIGINSTGQKSGEAVILFKTMEEAKRAFIEKQGDNVGHRWIELILIKNLQYNRIYKA